MERKDKTSYCFDSNQFANLSRCLSYSPSVKSSTPQSQPQPQLQPQSTPRQPNIHKSIRICTTFSTISSRILSFQKWPHTNPGPQQLARLGFYHQPRDDAFDNVCCFACGVELFQWTSVGPYTTKELLDNHDEDCLWADMIREVEPSVKDPAPMVQSVTISAQSRQKLASQHRSRIPKATTPYAKTSSTISTNTVNTTKPTYASVLKTPPKSQPQPPVKAPSITPQSTSPSLPKSLTPRLPTTTSRPSSPTPTLTIVDLRKRFHNKPSPLKPTQLPKPSTDTSQYYLAATATESLSKFLISALPAFTKFLSDIHGGQWNGHTPYQKLGDTTPVQDLHQEFGYSGQENHAKSDYKLETKR